MARIVYACRFELPEETALNAIILPAYERWIADRYRANHATDIAINLNDAVTCGDLPDGHKLQLEKFEADSVAYRLSWNFPGDNGLSWLNTMRAAALDGVTVVEHQVALNSAEYLVTPAPFSVGAPRVIREICRDNAVIVGEMKLKSVVYPVSVDGVEQFIALLESSLRKLPIVFLSCFASGRVNEIDGADLAEQLSGVAIVAAAADPSVTRALSDRVGQLGCYDGGARIYWPGFSDADDRSNHPLFLASRIAVLGAKRAAQIIERTIFSVAAFRFVPTRRIDRIISTVEATKRADRAAAAVADPDTTWEQYALEISAELDDVTSKLQNLQAENDNLRANQALLFSVNTNEPEEDISDSVVRSPESVLDAVEFAKNDFRDLVFLESCIDSAEKSPFKRPEQVYWALGVMDKVAAVWSENQGSGDIRQMLIDAGLGKRVSNFISKTSQGKYGDEYKFYYEGSRITFSNHVTLGAGSADTCASIHFLPDDKIGKIVIAYVGRHLSNTKS